MRQRRWNELFSDYDCKFSYHPRKSSIKEKLLAAQNEATKEKNAPAEMMRSLDQQMEKKGDEADKMYYDLRDMYWWPGVDIKILTMEQYLAFSRENQVPGMVKPEIRGNVNFEIKSQFMRELREGTFSENKNEDAHDHVDRVLNIGPILGMTPTQALNTIQTMADHSQKLHEGTSNKNISSSSDTNGLAAVISKMDNLGRDMKKLKENVHAIQVDEVKYGEFGCPTPFNGSSEDKFRIGFLDDERSETTKVKTSKAILKWKLNLPEQSVNHYVKPYVPPIPFHNRLKQHAEETLVHKTMESLKKIKINWPFLKKIKQTDNYPRYMKDLVANKELNKDDGEVRMNPRSLALLQNLLPLKENDPGSFILPCSIGRLDFNNALADLGASINIIPFSMFKRLGIGKLEPINMVIEMEYDTKCIPKWIVKNLLIKIDKFILPIDFVILDMIEDLRMPIILGRPLLATTHAKVDIFQKPISLEVGNKKRKRFKNEYDNNEEFEDPDGCVESKENEILGTVLNILHDEWFKGTKENDDDLEGIIDYLKLTLYDGFVDSDNEEFKEKKCRLLGMPYIKPPLILIEKIDVTRYSIGPEEVYTNIKFSGVEELSRTRGNIA
ncbi:hypothetical protein Tco_0016332 [Tanacetum coccineum]